MLNKHFCMHEYPNLIAHKTSANRQLPLSSGMSPNKPQDIALLPASGVLLALRVQMSHSPPLSALSVMASEKCRGET